MKKRSKEPLDGEYIPKSGAGRPAQYHDGLVDELIQLKAQGYSDCEIQDKWGISKATFYRWLNEHPKLKEADEVGTVKLEAWYTRLAKLGMTKQIKVDNKLFETLARPHMEGYKVEQKKDGSTINIENMQVLQNVQQLSAEDLNKEIQHLIQKGALDGIEGRDTEEASAATSGEGTKKEV